MKCVVCCLLCALFVVFCRLTLFFVVVHCWLFGIVSFVDGCLLIDIVWCVCVFLCGVLWFVCHGVLLVVVCCCLFGVRGCVLFSLLCVVVCLSLVVFVCCVCCALFVVLCYVCTWVVPC